MSELTKEDLEHIKRTCGGRVTTDPKFDGFYRCVSAAIDELLALRSREAGDEEVEKYPSVQAYRPHDKAIQVSVIPTEELKEIITARQQLREAREEIERLTQIIRELKDNFGEMEVGA